MSDSGSTGSQLLQINASATQIQNLKLRDIVTAISVLARPIGIASCGLAIAIIGVGIAIRAAHHGMTEWDVAGAAVVASAFGVAAWFRTKDKAAVAAAQ